VDLTQSEITLTLISGGPLQVRVVDQRVIVSGDAPTVVTLEDQGPVIRGRPPRLADIGVVPHVAHDVDIDDLHLPAT
jgi:alpha,alpha-trehalose phosphorylase